MPVQGQDIVELRKLSTFGYQLVEALPRRFRRFLSFPYIDMRDREFTCVFVQINI